MPRRMSLASRLSAFFLVALAIALVGFSATLYWLARDYMRQQLDNQLLSTLDMLEAAVDVEPGGLEWEPADRRLSWGLERQFENIRWIIADSAGQVIDRSQNSRDEAALARWRPSDWPTDPPDAAVFGDLPEWRAAARRLRLNELLQKGRTSPDDDDSDDDVQYTELFVIVGVSPTPVQASLRSLALTVCGLSAGLWIVSALVGRWLARGALAPLTRMAVAAREIRGNDPAERLPDPGSRDELHELCDAFNGLLGRLHDTIERQRNFAGEASHQLRTPLAGMLSLIEVVRRRERPAEEYEVTLDRVREEATRMQRMVESLLFLARPENDAMSLALEEVSLSNWLETQVARYADHPRFEDLKLTVEPVAARTHPGLLAQMFDNLLDNALKYSAPGTPVRIELTRAGSKVLLLIRDAGCGIADIDSRQLFVPFFRAASSRRQGIKGVGLGLAIVKRIADRLGATVRVASQPGVGTTVAIELPEAREQSPWLVSTGGPDGGGGSAWS